MIRQFGLIGYPLSHSFSQAYFTDKFRKEDLHDCTYENFPISSIDAFPALLEEHPALCGLNVTIPYKEAVIPYLDSLDDAAERIGAVNTIRFSDEGRIGYNTDHFGFTESLRPLLSKRSEMPEALILGTGGASKAVAYALEQLGIRYTYVSRSRRASVLGYEDLDAERISAATLIVNTTPLGMYPETDTLPDLHYDAVGPEHILYDLVYNPGVTRFLAEGQKRGALTKNGLEMLKLQAEKAWAIWNDY